MTEAAAALQLAYHVGRSRLGRRRLALATGLSEMAARVELERLRDRGLIRIERAGVELTDAGSAHFAPMLEPIRGICELALTSLRLGLVALAAQVRAEERSAAWILRDRAVRGGASGLLLLAWDDAGWRFAHDGEPVSRRNARDAAAIEYAFADPQDEDRLVIAFGSTLPQASLGLWHVLADFAPMP
ncbi:hypothetical protein KJ567_03025 [Candidatus Bipolaricaulota bacterium]|nr:hypothetical protein [Candidatus Bipolaricaulota bacterium]